MVSARRTANSGDLYIYRLVVHNRSLTFKRCIAYHKDHNFSPVFMLIWKVGSLELFALSLLFDLYHLSALQFLSSLFNILSLPPVQYLLYVHMYIDSVDFTQIVDQKITLLPRIGKKLFQKVDRLYQMSYRYSVTSQCNSIFAITVDFWFWICAGNLWKFLILLCFLLRWEPMIALKKSIFQSSMASAIEKHHLAHFRGQTIPEGSSMFSEKEASRKPRQFIRLSHCWVTESPTQKNGQKTTVLVTLTPSGPENCYNSV